MNDLRNVPLFFHRCYPPTRPMSWFGMHCLHTWPRSSQRAVEPAECSWLGVALEVLIKTDSSAHGTVLWQVISSLVLFSHTLLAVELPDMVCGTEDHTQQISWDSAGHKWVKRIRTHNTLTTPVSLSCSSIPLQGSRDQLNAHGRPRTCRSYEETTKGKFTWGAGDLFAF